MRDHPNGARGLGRRGILLLPLASAGCGVFDDWFGESKTPLPGTRTSVIAPGRGLSVDNPAGRPVRLPPPVRLDAWPQPGGNAAHDVGHPAANTTLARAFETSIGTGGGYRRKLTAQPVSAGGRVFTLDSDAVVTALELVSGRRIWQFETQSEDEDNSNIGGGLSLDGATLFVTTGRGEVLALSVADGKPRWRKPLGTAARSAATAAEGKLFVATLDDQVVALSAVDGARLWSYAAGSAATSVLGLPAPAYADGLLVAGFGSGDLVSLRAESGAVVWADSLAAARGRNSLVDLSAVRGRPVISEGRVFAGGLGGLFVGLDLRSGRRLWEREIATAESPWLAGDWLFVLTTSQQLVALNRADGAIAWVTQLPRFEDEEKSTDPISWVGPALAQGRVWAASSNGLALAADAVDGKLLSRQEIPGAASVAPAVVNGTLLFVIDDGSLFAVR